MKFINIPEIARNGALILGLAFMSVLSVDAQNNTTGNTANRTANGNSAGAPSQAGNGNNATTNTTRNENTNTTRTETTNTPQATATSTPRTEVQTVVKEERGFPWGLLGLLGLLGLIPKRRSVEVAGVREETRETRTTPDNRV